MQDEENNTTYYTYDAASQLTQVVDALNQKTSYGYDMDGNKTSQTDANGNTTSYIYDTLNRRTSRTLSLLQTESWTYDFEQNQITHVDFNGKTTTLAYDSLNRLLSKKPDASFSATTVSFMYTATGQRQSMTDASGVTTYTYSNRDQALQKATPEGALNYTYDLAGNVASVVSSNAGGTNVSYAWDADNRLSSVTDNVTNGLTNYSYDATSQIASFTYPNGATHAFTYDLRDRTTALSVTGPGLSAIASYGQTFGPSGHKLSVAESGGRAEGYGYDLIYRLLNETIAGDPVTANNGVLTYMLDPVGNRKSLTSTLMALPAQTLNYDADDRLTTDTYDANGNTVSSGGTNYTYDFEDRLLSTSSGVQIAYDGDGKRVSETVGGITTKFLVDDPTPTHYAQVAEETANGAVGAQFTYGLMRISQNRDGVVSYYGYDAGGSTRDLLNGAGTVTDTYEYDAFGNLVAQTGSTANEFLCRGEQFDSALGMYYLRARYYVPRTGRFLTADKYEGEDVHACDCPLKTPRININQVFGYANADPVGMIDPGGRGPLLDALVDAVIWVQVAAYVAIGTAYLTLKLAPDILHFVLCADAWVTGDPGAQAACTQWPLINQN